MTDSYHSISRSDLCEPSSSPDPAFSTEDVREQWRHQLEKVYSNGYESQHGPHAATGAAQPPEPVPDQSDEDAYEFRLFTRKKQTAQPATKIRIESPPPVSKEPGFVRARRSESYYFTGAGADKERGKYKEVAVEGERVLKEAQSRWVSVPYDPHLSPTNSKPSSLALNNRGESLRLLPLCL